MIISKQTEVNMREQKDIIIKGVDLQTILENHRHWLYENCKDWNNMRADLRYADLSGADLSGADLRYADLSGANLSGADLENIRCDYFTIGIELACPAEGSFIAYKRCKNVLIKLEIPSDASRSSATTRKCRCNKAKVLDIVELNGYNKTDNHLDKYDHYAYSQNTLYEVDEMVYPDSYDENRWNECSNGIHFFMSEHDAIMYY